MSTLSIKIQKNPTPTPGQPAVFAPKAVVANAGDNLTWDNTDSQDHWPAPSAANPSGWIQFPIPPNSQSRGDVALAKNVVNVTLATNGNPVVLTLNGPAPATGTSVTIAYTAPTPPPSTPSPWAALKGTFVVTRVGSNSCSIPVNSSGFGPFSPATSGTLAMTIPLAYRLNYQCALHPDETGTITVNTQL